MTEYGAGFMDDYFSSEDEDAGDDNAEIEGSSASTTDKPTTHPKKHKEPKYVLE